MKIDAECDEQQYAPSSDAETYKIFRSYQESNRLCTIVLKGDEVFAEVFVKDSVPVRQERMQLIVDALNAWAYIVKAKS